MISQFLYHFEHYLIEILPALAIGFLLSGLIREFIPTSWVEKQVFPDFDANRIAL